MSGRRASWLLLAALLVALVWQTGRLRDRLEASRLLLAVEASTMSAVAGGRIPSSLLARNLEALRRAAELDPANPGIPLARGSLYRLLRQPASAIAAYRQALELEPRPEIYLNLGHALLEAGRPEEARQSFRRAVALDVHLAPQVPATLR